MLKKIKMNCPQAKAKFYVTGIFLSIAVCALTGCVMTNAVPVGYQFPKKTSEGIVAFSVACNLGNYRNGQIAVYSQNFFVSTFQPTQTFNCIASNSKVEINHIIYKIPAGSYEITGWSIPGVYYGSLIGGFNKTYKFTVEKGRVNYLGRLYIIKSEKHRFKYGVSNTSTQNDYQYFYNHLKNISPNQYRHAFTTQEKLK